MLFHPAAHEQEQVPGGYGHIGRLLANLVVDAVRAKRKRVIVEVPAQPPRRHTGAGADGDQRNDGSRRAIDRRHSPDQRDIEAIVLDVDIGVPGICHQHREVAKRVICPPAARPDNVDARNTGREAVLNGLLQVRRIGIVDLRTVLVANTPSAGGAQRIEVANNDIRHHPGGERGIPAAIRCHYQGRSGRQQSDERIGRWLTIRDDQRAPIKPSCHVVALQPRILQVSECYDRRMPPAIQVPTVLRLRRMVVEDLAAAGRIERASFTGEWPATAFENELRHNSVARYVLLERETADGRWEAIGFAGLWLQFDQAHVVTVAVVPVERRNGFGRLLVYALLRVATHYGMADATLEMRKSNAPAHALYSRFGFMPVGERRRYYPDGEDAVIMTTESFESERFRARLSELADRLVEAFGPDMLPKTDRMGF